MSDEEYMRWGSEATRAFHRLHLRAKIECVLHALTGRPSQMLRFADALGEQEFWPAGNPSLREIPLDNIVGSVDKPDAFTPGTFLPRHAYSKERWKRAYAGSLGNYGLPPIELYQIGERYFIKDGHHRVSVARYLGARTILAEVTDFTPGVRMSTDTPLVESNALISTCADA